MHVIYSGEGENRRAEGVAVPKRRGKKRKKKQKQQQQPLLPQEHQITGNSSRLPHNVLIPLQPRYRPQNKISARCIHHDLLSTELPLELRALCSHPPAAIPVDRYPHHWTPVCNGAMGFDPQMAAMAVAATQPQVRPMNAVAGHKRPHIALHPRFRPGGKGANQLPASSFHQLGPEVFWNPPPGPTAQILYNDDMLLLLDFILSSIDQRDFDGREADIFTAIDRFEDPNTNMPANKRSTTNAMLIENNTDTKKPKKKTSALLEKVNIYSNSKLPENLPKLHIHLQDWQLVCVAAHFSNAVYTKPKGLERETHVDSDWREGTKAMVIKSVPMDNRNAIVIAIRGSSSLKDWTVNLNSAPSSPRDFLDNPGNWCHSGFLNVARRMIKPVAARLRTLIEENPSRSSCSLVMTGHSAGGAVASLLFSHMLSSVSSELTDIAGCFKKIHCITFGTPPVSMLPLMKPSIPRYRKSLFLSFINEGDPVARADRAYMRSLLNLYTSRPGRARKNSAPETPAKRAQGRLRRSTWPNPQLSNFVHATKSSQLVWPVPPSSLSTAGQLVILRKVAGGAEDDLGAFETTDAGLRGVIFANPIMHMMTKYTARVEALAAKAVTGGTWKNS